MGKEVSPVTPIQPRDRRQGPRRTAERRASSRDLVPTEGPPAPDSSARHAAAPGPDAGGAAFTAQIMGQSEQRRGLKGGPPVLDAARSTYLGAEYSGQAERRPRPGGSTDEDI